MDKEAISSSKYGSLGRVLCLRHWPSIYPVLQQLLRNVPNSHWLGSLLDKQVPYTNRLKQSEWSAGGEWGIQNLDTGFLCQAEGIMVIREPCGGLGTWGACSSCSASLHFMQHVFVSLISSAVFSSLSISRSSITFVPAVH